MRSVVSPLGRAVAAGHMQEPPAPPPCLWCFDRGTETLIFIDFENKRGHAWPRAVWERFQHEGKLLFTLAGVRTLPAPPMGVA